MRPGLYFLKHVCDIAWAYKRDPAFIRGNTVLLQGQPTCPVLFGFGSKVICAVNNTYKACLQSSEICLQTQGSYMRGMGRGESLEAGGGSGESNIQKAQVWRTIYNKACQSFLGNLESAHFHWTSLSAPNCDAITILPLFL